MPELHPALVLLAGAAATAVLPRRSGAAVALAAAVAALAITVTLPDGASSTWDWYGLELTPLLVDGLSKPFATVFAIVAVAAALYGWSTMGRLERAAALGTAAAGLGVVLAGDLLSLFLAWELKVSTVVLLVWARRRAASSAAGLRYLGVHLAGGVVLLAGIVGHLVDTGSLAVGPLGTDLSGWLILIGFLLGAAAVPLNAWLPDAYPTATVAGAVVLSAFTTKSAVYALARSFAGLDLLIWLGVAMALFGVVYALLEDDIRRLLSYHIISQVGFMVAAIGVGTATAVSGATAHASAHVLYKGLLFMAAGAVVHATGRSRASELGGLARRMPVVLVLYMVGAVSIAGVPLFSGYPAKELAVASVGDGGASAAEWLLKLASVGTFLSVAIKLPLTTFGGRAATPDGRSPATVRAVPTTMLAAMGGLAVLNVAIGVVPALLYDRLPSAVAFQPYASDKLLAAVQLLVFAGLGAWLVRARLAPKPTTQIDTDWVYRELPARLAPTVATVGPRVTTGVAAARGRLSDAVRAALAPVRERWQQPVRPVSSGRVLGGVLLAAVVLVMLTGVL